MVYIDASVARVAVYEHGVAVYEEATADNSGQKILPPSPADENDDGGLTAAMDEADEEESYYDEDEHDTLGLLWDDGPQEGGVAPDADFTLGGVSGITNPSTFVPDQINIPLPLMNEILSPIIDVVVEKHHEVSMPSVATTVGTSICTSEEDRREAAKKNLEAGIEMEASVNAAFDDVAAYFAAGRKQLGSNGWEVDHKTMLKLCSEGANACYLAGDIDKMNELIDEVLSKDISVTDKFRVYEIKMLAEQAAGNYQESISLGFDFRRQLGLASPPKRPSSTLTALIWFMKAKRAVGKRTVEELANLPELTDERIIMGQRILELLVTSCYQAQPAMFPFVIFLSLRATLEHGISASSCDAFSGFGLLLCGAFGEPHRGREMAKVAKLILAKPGMARMKSRTTFICEACIHHWTAPLQESLAPLLEGYQLGLEMGDLESAEVNLSFYNDHHFYTGCPIDGDSIAAIIDLHVGLQNDKSAEESSEEQIIQELYIQIYLLAYKKLQGINLEENEKDFHDILTVAEQTGNQNLRSYVFIGQLELKVFFGEWNAAAILVAKAWDIRAELFGTFAGVRFTIFEALVSLKASQSSTGMIPRWKWKRRALKSIKLIRGWAKKGNVNIVHNLHLLEAELAILEGKNGKAADSFKSAIAVASAAGFLHDRALAHELASSFFECRGDGFLKDYHMENAIKSYVEWGATAKVNQLSSLVMRSQSVPPPSTATSKSCASCTPIGTSPLLTQLK